MGFIHDRGRGPKSIPVSYPGSLKNRGTGFVDRNSIEILE
jgi:hypothetical protein